MTAWFESAFEFLFKYRPLVLAKGRLVFDAPGPVVAVAAALAVLGILALFTYRRVGARTGPADRRVLSAVRAAIVTVLAVCLLRPALLVTTAVPQRNVVGILLDDSQSMQIADDGTTSRGSTLQREFRSAASPVLSGLEERFQLRVFRFARGASRIATGDSLAFRGTRSDLAAALDDARRDLAALPLAALILVTDGADNADSALTGSLLSLQAAGIPVHTVGLGRERFPMDLELGRVEAPRFALRGSSVLVEALVRQQGAGADSADLIVEEGGQILAATRFRLPGDGQAASVRMPVPLSRIGSLQLVTRVSGLPGETVARNNTRHALVSVVDREERILYFEGEPRPEFAFLRRAVAEDSNLVVVGLQRTAESKFLRLGVADSLDLAGGFPTGREELFRYRGLILGSVEAAAFTVEQLRMIQDFAGRRGGGVLFLGGRRAFGEGGYRNTPIEELLPVTIDIPPDTGYLRTLDVTVTPSGRTHPAARLAPSEAGSAQLWDSLPPVTTVNPIGSLKPGATALLSGSDTAGGGAQAVLSYHRYGRGKAAALAVQDAWLWRMHAEVALDDSRYQTFVRQLLRWLVGDVPERVSLSALTDEVGPGEPVSLEVEVRDAAHLPVNGATVSARVTSPSGTVTTVPLDWAIGTDGRYRAAFPALEEGEYRIEPQAISGGDTLAAEPAYVRAGDVGREFFGAELRAATLRRIARETGGQYYTAETVSGLPRDIVYTEKGITRTEHLDLWDMPFIFLLLIGLLTAEWSLRRSRGLA
jgi:uncharacterized membrane protein